MDRLIAHANAAGVVPPLSGRTAVVTGGASGIGRAIALRLAADGAIVAVDRKPADDPGPGEGFIVADLARPDDCTGAIARARATYGPISILVNNAGFQHVSSLASFPRERWQAMIDVMLTAPFCSPRRSCPTWSSWAVVGS